MALLGHLLFVVRRLTRQDRQFALFACGIMALGLWAATFIFGVANALLLRPLPYKDADHLLRIAASHAASQQLNRGLSWASFEAVRTLPAVEEAAAYEARGLNVTVGSEPRRVAGAAVTASLFNLLEVAPVAGRVFSEEESRRGDPVVVVSERLVHQAHWTREGAIGQTLAVEGHDRTIVGVMPASFRFPEVAKAWIPLPPTSVTPALDGGLVVVARVRDNGFVALREQLPAAANARGQAGHERGWTFETQSLNPLQAEGLGPLVFTAVVAATLLLLVVSANVAALMLARGVARQAEFGLMVALGASRRRIVLQLLMESGVIAMVAGVLALTLTAWTLAYVPRLLPVAELPEWIRLDVDTRVIVFVIIAAALGAFSTGLIPALQATRGDVAAVIRSGSRTFASGRATQLQRGLVGGQLLVVTVLLIGGGLMLRSYVALANADLGYDPAGAYMLETELPQARYGDTASVNRFYASLVERLEGAHDVRAAAVAGGPGVRGGTQGVGSFEEINLLGGGAAQTARVEQVVVSSGFFETLQLPLKEGRGFLPNEAGDVAVVTEAFVRRHWPDASPLGQTLAVRVAGVLKPMRVIGIAGDMREPFVGEGGGTVPQPRVYLPLAFGISRSATLYVRSPEEASGTIAASMRQAVQGLDPNQAVWATTSLVDFVSVARSPVKWFGYLLGSCAAVATVVACVGLYGVVAYGVRRRQREFAIRATLGARPSQVLGLILLDALRPSAIGIALGIAGGAGLGRALAILLYGVPTFDLAVTGVAASVLLSAVLTAALLPSVKLSRSTPSLLLRAD